MKQFISDKGSYDQFRRERLLARLDDAGEWDLVVIGGGATGLGVALDAVSRGYKTLLLEQADFAKGTSSKSTKLVHGGVRYLAQGNVDLVREALHERGLLLRNAPHLVRNQTFIIPNYEFLKGPFYWIGLKIYDLLAGRLSFGKSEYVSRDEVLRKVPSLVEAGLYNGIRYHDGQFDDARLALNVAQTVVENGGVVLNYMGVTGLVKDSTGKVTGVAARDMETSLQYEFKSKAVVNATGVFVNDILEMDDRDKPPLVRPSQGAHVVVDRSFLKSDEAIMIPETSDGRVMFAVPWHSKVILGTTDLPVGAVSLDPKPMEEEVDYILETAGKYLVRQPRRADVLSIYAGLRPLAASEGSGAERTKEISRSHKILVQPSGLVTITGGKWTTFRKMGEDAVEKVIAIAGLPAAPSKSAGLLIHGAGQGDGSRGIPQPDDVYGTDRVLINELIAARPDLGTKLHPDFEFNQAEVVLAVRNEMARTIEDVLARRVRILFLDAQAAIDCAPVVAGLLAEELGKDNSWKEHELTRFFAIAKGYLLTEMTFAPHD
ncbi:glycerol-3-phosphate dehydrogenase/oxidase [Ravibacter arvi]|uniref:Glycerol-3-phosphate dehydrogenase/oxidase n=1 Tax=Ravibacter arvi TaxID=2051041 RepID=A0ABP8MAJ4_9BACT